MGTPATAHEERPAQFPDGTGHRPQFLGYDNPLQRVVCRPDSAATIRSMPPGPVKHRNRHLLEDCRFRSIQDAINTIRRPNTSVYVLPGTYHERKYAEAKRSDYCAHLQTQSREPLASSEYIGSISSPDPGAEEEAAEAGESNPIALSYADQRRCPHNLNLIALFGDATPGNDSIRCDSRFCGTQLVGTGRRPTDVVVDNRFAKLNAIRADRMGGFYLSNMTFQQAEFNAIYVLETDGFVIDRVVARGNDEYGVLAFASDHGLIQDSEAYYNGDSGFYPAPGPTSTPTTPSSRPRATRSRSGATPATTTRWATPAPPGTPSGRTTTSSTTTPPASRRTRCSPAIPACRRTTPGGATTTSTPTTATTTRRTSTPASARSPWRSAATSTARSVR